MIFNAIPIQRYRLSHLGVRRIKRVLPLQVNFFFTLYNCLNGFHTTKRIFIY